MVVKYVVAVEYLHLVIGTHRTQTNHTVSIDVVIVVDVIFIHQIH